MARPINAARSSFPSVLHSERLARAAFTPLDGAGGFSASRSGWRGAFMVFLVTLSFCLSQCRPECLRNCHSSRTDDNPLFAASNSQNVPWMVTSRQWRAELRARGERRRRNDHRARSHHSAALDSNGGPKKRASPTSKKNCCDNRIQGNTLTLAAESEVTQSQNGLPRLENITIGGQVPVAR